MKNKSLSNNRIDVPTLNEEHAYYYPEEKVKKVAKEIKEVVTQGCMGTSANCYEIKKKIDKILGEKLIK